MTMRTGRAGVSAFIRQHAVAAYYVLAFAISWGGIVALLGPAGLFMTGSTTPLAAGGALLAGPAGACLLLTALLDGKAGFRGLALRLRRWRVGGRWYAVALLTGPLVMVGTAAVIAVAVPGFYVGVMSSAELWSTVATALVVGVSVGFFEELGWTGFALPRLRRRHGMLPTGALMGVLWGAWHFPMFAGSTDPAGALPPGVIVAAFLFAWLPAYRVLMVWVHDRTESLPLAMLMHVPISATTLVLAAMASEANDGIAILFPVLGWGVAFWAIAGVVAWRQSPSTMAAVASR
ncbi:CPBP family intramembrane glutamic endopeptidase [Sinomonas atrocyanea]